MTEQALRKMIAAGESTRQEFKSWVKCKDYRQRKDLAVKSAVALAKSGHQTGKKMEGVESAALNSPKYSSTTKTLVGGVLSQSDKKSLNNLKWGVQFTTVRSIFYNRNQI